MYTAIASQHNPYIIGRPIHEKAEFFGRDDLFRFIADNLNQQAQVILLHGQRRIGKSSVLAQIPNFVELDDFEFVSLSLEGQANKDLGDLLSELARDIVDQLEHVGSLVKPMKAPAKSAFKKDVSAFSETFLPKVYAALGDKNLVLLLDEFDVLEDHSPESAIEQFFPYLQSILKRHPKLYLVPVVGRRLDELPNLLNLFRRAPYQEVGLLQGKWARDLVTKPAAGMLNYAPEAIDAVLELTAGHPYLTQVLCFAVFAHLREEERRDVTRADVEGCVDKAIELGQAGLTWFRDGLPIAERVMLSAVAAAQAIGELTHLPKSSLDLLEDNGVVITDELRRTLRNLTKWGFAENTIRKTLRIKIPLVTFWLTKKYSLKDEIKELEAISPEANTLYEEAYAKYHSHYEVFKKSKRSIMRNILHAHEFFLVDPKDFNADLENVRFNITKIESIFHEVLEVNPNHFEALFRLSELSLDNYLEDDKHNSEVSRLTEKRNQVSVSLMTQDVGTDDHSLDLVSLYERIYRIDVSRSRDGLTTLLISIGKNHIVEGNFIDAKKVFDRMKFLGLGGDSVKKLAKIMHDDYILNGKIFSFLRCLRQVIDVSQSDEQRITYAIREWKAQEDKFRKNEENRKSVETREKNARIQYQKEVKHFANEGEISSVARRILTKLASELGIGEEEARKLENQILAHYRNLQEYELAFVEVCNENYPLSDRTLDELKELQNILQLSSSQVQRIETKVLADLNHLASEVQTVVSNVSDKYSYSSENIEGQTAIVYQVIAEIEKTPSLRERLIAAMSQGGSAALEQAINNNSPAANIIVAGIKGWIEGNSQNVINLGNRRGVSRG